MAAAPVYTARGAREREIAERARELAREGEFEKVLRRKPPTEFERILRQPRPSEFDRILRAPRAATRTLPRVLPRILGGPVAAVIGGIFTPGELGSGELTREEREELARDRVLRTSTGEIARLPPPPDLDPRYEPGEIEYTPRPPPPDLPDVLGEPRPRSSKTPPAAPLPRLPDSGAENGLVKSRRRRDLPQPLASGTPFWLPFLQRTRRGRSSPPPPLPDASADTSSARPGTAVQPLTSVKLEALESRRQCECTRPRPRPSDKVPTVRSYKRRMSQNSLDNLRRG